MPTFSPRQDPEEQGEDGSAELVLDLDERVCPTCGRLLHPWQAHCPEDGAAAVPRHSVQHVAPPPAHLLEDDEE